MCSRWCKVESKCIDYLFEHSFYSVIKFCILEIEMTGRARKRDAWFCLSQSQLLCSHMKLLIGGRVNMLLARPTGEVITLFQNVPYVPTLLKALTHERGCKGVFKQIKNHPLRKCRPSN